MIYLKLKFIPGRRLDFEVHYFSQNKQTSNSAVNRTGMLYLSCRVSECFVWLLSVWMREKEHTISISLFLVKREKITVFPSRFSPSYRKQPNEPNTNEAFATRDKADASFSNVRGSSRIRGIFIRTVECSRRSGWMRFQRILGEKNY